MNCGFAPSMIDGVPVLAPELAGGNPADAAYAYQDLRDAEERHFWFTSRHRLIAWAIRRYFPDARTFFDVGCGTGGVLAALRPILPRLRFSAGDALIAGLAFAKAQLPDVSFVQIDLRRLPFECEFDLFGAFDVLEHLDDDGLALREMFRSTKPGGGVILTVPQHQFLWSALDDYSHHRRRYRRRDLIDKVKGAGYHVLRATSFMTLTMPLQLLSRARQQNAATLDPAGEMRLNPAVNATLATMCAAERAAVRAGVSFPFGGSLLVVAGRPSS